MKNSFFFTIASAVTLAGCSQNSARTTLPNIILIYADDLGYGDVSCYGATRIKTPDIDRLALQGLRFTNAHCTSSTSTPSRYSLLTGQYAWRREGTAVLTGDAPAVIGPGTVTLPSVLKNAGYSTGVVGKWHLGLGPEGGADWNGEIKPGPLDIGFDYNFIIPATGDRVPCVYVENRKVINLDPADPIRVSFREPVPGEPVGRDHPELLKLHPSHGHDMTIVNGISRIGWMSGGKSALWKDEDMADVITSKAVGFIGRNRDNPFFLYFATHGIHVPRVPHPRFSGLSGMGPRGDAILEFDWSVGKIMQALDSLNLADKTLLIVTSDNGPVVDDGYRDHAVELLNGHTPAGPLRGGKYSLFDGGTRVIFIARWPGRISPGTSDALFSQIDLMASLAAIASQQLPENAGTDSFNHSDVLLGKSQKGREWLIEHSGRLAIIRDNWKYIVPGPGPRFLVHTATETGNDTVPQLYNLEDDPGEKINLAPEHPEMVVSLMELLDSIKGNN